MVSLMARALTMPAACTSSAMVPAAGISLLVLRYILFFFGCLSRLMLAERFFHDMLGIKV